MYNRKYHRKTLIIKQETDSFSKQSPQTAVATLELKNGRGKINIQGQSLSDNHAYLVAPRKGENQFVDVGNVGCTFDPDNVAGSGMAIEDFDVLVLGKQGPKGDFPWWSFVGYMGKKREWRRNIVTAIKEDKENAVEEVLKNENKKLKLAGEDNLLKLADDKHMDRHLKLVKPIAEKTVNPTLRFPTGKPDVEITPVKNPKAGKSEIMFKTISKDQIANSDLHDGFKNLVANFAKEMKAANKEAEIAVVDLRQKEALVVSAKNTPTITAMEPRAESGDVVEVTIPADAVEPSVTVIEGEEVIDLTLPQQNTGTPTITPMESPLIRGEELIADTGEKKKELIADTVEKQEAPVPTAIKTPTKTQIKTPTKTPVDTSMISSAPSPVRNTVADNRIAAKSENVTPVINSSPTAEKKFIDTSMITAAESPVRSGNRGIADVSSITPAKSMPKTTVAAKRPIDTSMISSAPSPVANTKTAGGISDAPVITPMSSTTVAQETRISSITAEDTGLAAPDEVDPNVIITGTEGISPGFPEADPALDSAGTQQLNRTEQDAEEDDTIAPQRTLEVPIGNRRESLDVTPTVEQDGSQDGSRIYVDADMAEKISEQQRVEAFNQQVWEIFENNPQSQPFEEPESEWVTTQPLEIWTLPIDHSILKDSFFIYSQLRFEHVILGRYIDGSVIMGIPDYYDSSFRQEAMEMGLIDFKCDGEHQEGSQLDGTFGYWLKKLN